MLALLKKRNYEITRYLIRLFSFFVARVIVRQRSLKANYQQMNPSAPQYKRRQDGNH